MKTESFSIGINVDPRTLSRRRVLVVDDEPAALFAYRKLLEGAGYGVDLCESADQSMEMLRKNRYFAVVSDMRFGGTDNRDGIRILTSVRDEHPVTRVILVTGTDDGGAVQSMFQREVPFFFQKPVAPELLLSALKSLGDRP